MRVAHLYLLARALRLLDEAKTQLNPARSSIQSLGISRRNRAQEQMQSVDGWRHRQSHTHSIVIAGGYNVGENDAVDQGRLVAMDE